MAVQKSDLSDKTARKEFGRRRTRSTRRWGLVRFTSLLRVMKTAGVRSGQKVNEKDLLKRMSNYRVGKRLFA